MRADRFAIAPRNRTDRVPPTARCLAASVDREWQDGVSTTVPERLDRFEPTAQFAERCRNEADRTGARIGIEQRLFDYACLAQHAQMAAQGRATDRKSVV